MNNPGVSIVTVCMNRSGHLLQSAAAVAAWPHHAEHLVVDWSSTEPLRRADLPGDPRLRLLRVEGEERWNLCRAYNFAVGQACGAVILKLDADAWPSQGFDPSAPGLRMGDRGRVCAFGSGLDGRKGQLLIERRMFEDVGGFNELMMGYGFDDKDLRVRLRLLSGQEPAVIPADWLEVIAHSDEERAEQGRAGHGHWLKACQGQAAMRATQMANRLVAAYCPWSARMAASCYDECSEATWRVRTASIPRRPGSIVAELDHVGRMTFWGTFLAVPEVFLETLPFSLFPPAQDGRWDVRWWHRLWWWTGRQLLHLPVLALVGGRAAIAPLLGRRQRSGKPN
ncbi:glycosyltransferase family 2 protein [Synechococcus sp. Tobar12-5m-g]|uniref:glycosyltransferase family 2 protein n=1 Tax=unclassified Synechococcus TaxID=2626047 RepID=UPI0020CDDE98|nr:MULTISPECIES: galactosyltransferase-related protein [unclassified Synechococcus]MCP9772333.1 glycosyltransferase family 2 protein [Synechococcus sp. Tobar12-5m-g]MCP9873275.1 glycosyltransferase family 2 protein [Synechococcus sp. Cruz CV-v-12]